MKAFTTVLRTYDGTGSSLWIDIIAENYKQVVDYCLLNYPSYVISSCVPTNGDSVEVVNGKIEICVCKDDPNE